MPSKSINRLNFWFRIASIYIFVQWINAILFHINIMCAYNSAIIKFILKRVWKISNTSCLPLWIVNCHKYVSIICHRTLFAHTYDSWFRVGFCFCSFSILQFIMFMCFMVCFVLQIAIECFIMQRNNIKR